VSELVELADIIEPAAPVVATHASTPWLLALAALMAFVLVIALLRLRRSPRFQAWRRMRQLRRAFVAGAIDARELAYGVAAELRFGLRAARLRPTGAPSDQGESWQRLVTQLDALRYRPGAGLDAAQGARLVRDATHWLRRWR
jgi:hypothetical protein